MTRRSTLALGAVGLLAAAFATRRVIQDRRTPRVDYEVIDRFGDVEVRRYPPSVVVETVAPSENAAFRRLFGYISGENRTSDEISMTAPVETESGSAGTGDGPDEIEGGSGERISMTAPVETEGDAEGVRMAFYLPAKYDFDSAPRPTDESVRLVERPGRVLAALGFSWWATDDRVARKTDELRSSIAGADAYEVTGDPGLLRYEGPWVPPFLRTNEVTLPVRRVRSA
mgnify:FL=1